MLGATSHIGLWVKRCSFPVFCRDEGGASLIEYSLLIGLISAIVILAVAYAKSWVNASWQRLADVLGTVS